MVLYEMRQIGQVVVLRSVLAHGNLTIVVRSLDPPRGRVKLLMLVALITLITIMVPHFRSLLRNRRLRLALMSSHERLQIGILFVILLLKAFLRYLLFERVDLIEFADSFLIQTVDAFESALSDGFLVVGEEQASELRALEEVLAVVLLFRHREDFEAVRESVLLCGLGLHCNLTLRHNFIIFAHIFVLFLIAPTSVGVALRIERPTSSNIREERVIQVLEQTGIAISCLVQPL